MAMHPQSWRSAAFAIGGIVAITMAATTSAWALANSNPEVIPPTAHPFGGSYAEWSAEWWKWQLKLPKSTHPSRSLTGENCGAGQSGHVWFLAGTLVTEFPYDFYTVVREACTIPPGTALFFPIVNNECSTIEQDPWRGTTDDELLACAQRLFDGTIAVAGDLAVTIDGKPLADLERYRFQSTVFDFRFDDPADNILDVRCDVERCDRARSASDGYWIMLAPLSRGKHTVQFVGSFRDPLSGDLLFGLDVTYELTVAR